MEGNTSREDEIKPDIFDKIMHLPGFRIFEDFYKRNKGALMYLFFGALATLVNFVAAGVSKSLLEKAGASTDAISTLSTSIAWVIAAAFAYVTNRTWVFHSMIKSKRGILAEALSFFSGRLFTYFVEMFMMWLFYSVIGFNYWVIKIIANIVVLILNYVISKLIVFRKKKEKVPEAAAGEEITDEAADKEAQG
ncbi:MAG: GtrA family protein [Ruminococcus sp.]|nr:GtrA family protein [Ruminococcus sp.]